MMKNGVGWDIGTEILTALFLFCLSLSICIWLCLRVRKWHLPIS